MNRTITKAAMLTAVACGALTLSAGPASAEVCASGCSVGRPDAGLGLHDLVKNYTQDNLVTAPGNASPQLMAILAFARRQFAH